MERGDVTCERFGKCSFLAGPPRSQVWGFEIHFSGTRFCFYHVFKTNFSRHQFLGAQKNWGNAPPWLRAGCGQSRVSELVQCTCLVACCSQRQKRNLSAHAMDIVSSVRLLFEKKCAPGFLAS